MPPLWAPSAAVASLLPVLAALLMAGAGALLVRGRWAAWAGLPGAAGTLAGWAALLPLALAGQALVRPRTVPEHLMLPALAAVVLAASAPGLRGRLGRWAPVAAVALAGWWLAGLPPGRSEFWRAWAAFAVMTWVLVRLCAGQAARAWAAALAGCGGLAALGTPAALTLPGLVLAVALAPAALLGERSRVVPALLVAAYVMAGDLGVGRVPRGGLNGADLACLGALAAPALAALLERRMAPSGRRVPGRDGKGRSAPTRVLARPGRANPARSRAALAALSAAALTVAAVWAGGRLLAP